jgi:hypothetical protein
MRCAMEDMVDGKIPDFTALVDYDASNAAAVAARRDLDLCDIVGELRSGREGWLSWSEGLPLHTFYEPRSYAGHDWTFSDIPLKGLWEHDAHHAEQIADWRERREYGGQSGPKAVLLGALAAAREELLTAANLVPPEKRSSRSVCGVWTLKDVLGHIADWEALGAAGLAQMAAGQVPIVEHVMDIDAWNAAHVAARRDQPWEQVWDDLGKARRALVGALAEMSQVDLERRYPFPWGPEGTPYQWVVVYVDHDRTHARRLRTTSGNDAMGT